MRLHFFIAKYIQRTSMNLFICISTLLSSFFKFYTILHAHICLNIYIMYDLKKQCS